MPLRLWIFLIKDRGRETQIASETMTIARKVGVFYDIFDLIVKVIIMNIKSDSVMI